MAPALMAGKPQVLQQLFLRAIGDPRWEPDEFENSWQAAFGLHVEPLALDWHAKKTGATLVDRGAQFFHPTREYVSCTLDARRADDNTALDVKCINAFWDIDDAAAHYTPQMVVQVECAKASRAALLVVQGGTEPQEIEIYIDDEYRALVWDRIDWFWDCIQSFTPPHPLDFPRIVPPELWRRIDLDNDGDQPNWSNEMKELLTRWAETRDTAKEHDAIKAHVKEIFPDDCGKLVYAHYTVARAKNNAITIRQKGTQP